YVCLSVWEQRRLRWLAGFGAALAVVVVVGVAGASQALAGCIPDVPEQTTPGTIDQTRGVAGATLTSTKGSWLAVICGGAGAVHYQWFRDGTTSVGSDQSTYSPVAADVEHTLSVQVEGCND